MDRLMTRRDQASEGRGSRVVDRRAALALAQVVGEELVAGGAAAVVLMGSFARGTQGPHSDLDIVAVGEAEDAWLDVRDGLLISVSVATALEIEASFARPAKVGFTVPGWRDAVVLQDETGVARRFISRARAWGWDEIDPGACDRHVAAEITGLAEEAHKLVNLLRAGNRTGAAIQRNLLATRLAVVLAVHLRLLYDTENELWDIVSERLGSEWAAAQARALGLGGEPFRATSEAALELYELSTRTAWDLFTEHERAVVEGALAVARRHRGEVES